MNRRDIRIIAGFLVTAALFYWKILFTRQFSFLVGYEGANQAYSWYQFILSELRAGRLPVWDPFTFSGHTFAGEMQTGAFYPANFLLALIPFNSRGLWSPGTFNGYVVVTHVVAAYLMFRLIRLLGLSRFAGFIGGIVFSFCGALATPGWPHILESSIWLPLMFELLLRAAREKQTGRALALAASCGMALGLSILAGSLHVAMMNAIVLLTAGAWLAITNGPQRRSRAASVVVIAAVAALAFSAIQLFPSFEYGHQAYRYLGATRLTASQKIPYSEMQEDHLWPYAFIGFLFPTGFNGNMGAREVISAYIGIFPLALACTGIWRRRGDPWCKYLAGLAVTSYLYAIGPYSFLHGIIYALAPFLWMAREADRFMFLADFALAVLAAFGIDALFGASVEGSPWRPATRATNYILLAAAAALVIPAIYGHPELGSWVAMSLLLIILSAILYRYIVSGHNGSRAKSLVVLLILFDLSAFDWSMPNRAEWRSQRPDEMERLLSFRGAVEFLKSQPGPFRVEEAFSSSPNVGDTYRIEATMGAGATMLRHFDDIRSRSDLLNARYILRPASAAEPGAIWQDANWKIYESLNAFPRAWIVHQVEVEPDRSKLLRRMGGSGIDLRRVALVSAQPAQSPQRPTDDIPENVATAGYNSFAPEVNVHSSSQALLVLSEIYYSGWRATVNGSPAPIVEVDGGLRGIVVPAGASHVSLRYEPASVIAGAAMTIGAFVCWCVAWLAARRKSDLDVEDAYSGMAELHR